MIAYAKNPVAELALITNPQNMKKTKKKTTKRRNPASSRGGLNQLKKFSYPAAGILGGMVLGAQGSKLLDRFVPGSIPLAKKLVAVGGPIAAGMLLAGASKNDLVRYVAIGVGAAGIASGVRMVMPQLSSFPLAGTLADALAGPSGFVPASPAPERLLPVPTPVTLQPSGFAGGSGFAFDEDED